MRLLIETGGDVFPPGNGGGLPPLQFRELRRHVVAELVLPFHQLIPPTDHLLGGQPVVLCQWYEAQVYVGIALIHVNHG